MTPQELKNSILQRAIQGKLVEQRPEEGTGEELYREIQAEKQKLIKEGKIIAEKLLPGITEDEIPFEIPENWKWVYIGDVFLHNTGKAQNSSGSQKGVIRKFITTSNVYWNKFDFSKIKEMPFTEQELERCSAQKGDLLVCEGGDFGRAAIWNYDEDVCIQNHVHRLRPYLPVSIEYFYYIFYLYKNSGRLKGQGVAIQGLSSQAMHTILVSLPPLAEQKRIVAKIEEHLPLVDRYEKAWTKLEDFNKRFPHDMQKSILQLAIQGKLVSQRPEEGTGEELYQQIQDEKQKLIKDGKIKKEKPLPEITEGDMPFDIPESWKWVYIGDVFQHNTGKAQNSSGNQKGVIRKFITTSNLYWNKFDFSKIKEMPFTEQELERCSAHKGDLLVCEGGDFGRAAIWNYDEDVCIQNHVHRLRPYLPISIEYFYYIFYLYKSSGRLKGQGVAIQGLSSQAMHKILVPLPPLAEQKRIVAKIEELLPLCERLK